MFDELGPHQADGAGWIRVDSDHTIAPPEFPIEPLDHVRRAQPLAVLRRPVEHRACVLPAPLQALQRLVALALELLERLRERGPRGLDILGLQDRVECRVNRVLVALGRGVADIAPEVGLAILTPSEVKPPGALFEEVPCRMRDWPENNPVKNSFRGVLG